VDVAESYGLQRFEDAQRPLPFAEGCLMLASDHEGVLMGHMLQLSEEIAALTVRVHEDMKRARSISTALRFQILQRDRFTCQYCGAKAPTVALQIDHIIPVCRGGSRDPSNLRTACEDCNAGKGTLVVHGDAPPASSPLARLLEAEDALRLARAEWDGSGMDLRRLDLMLAFECAPMDSAEEQAACERLSAYLDTFVSDEDRAAI